MNSEKTRKKPYASVWEAVRNEHGSKVAGQSLDRRPTVKQRFFGRFKQFGTFLKKVPERSRDSGRRSRDRRPTVKQRFLDVSGDLRKF